ncbi:MAG TPA: ABC transporter ATP-binding protein [Oscillatoriales cyanobacterium M59_W2019_021]|nr:ABC transporter ATP-binding protein [Oscillatoriales cyanobacterium M4454_W2019_049]HIK51261.1 ABC transporter ATP-binding protein [Oscillatoriales cyanobacterium M59_W2019_021]
MLRIDKVGSSFQTKLHKAIAQLSYFPQTLRLLWSAARNWTIAWAILLVIQGLIPVAIVYLTRQVVNSLVAVTGAGLAWESLQQILFPTALLVGVLLLTSSLSSAIEWVRTAQAEYVEDYINTAINQKSIEVDLSVYESSEYYDYLNRALSNASSSSLALLENTGSLFQNSITLFSMAAVLIPYGLWLPAVLVVSAFPAFYMVSYFNRRYHHWWQKSTTDRRRLQYYQMLMTNNQVASELRLFNLGSSFQATYRQLRRQLRAERLKLIAIQSLGSLLASITGLIMVGLAMAWTVRQVLQGQMTLGDLALFFQAFNQGQNLLRSLLGSLGKIYRNSLFVSNLFAFLRLEPQIVDPPQPQPTPAKIQQGICFRNVSFAYPNSDRHVLKDFNLTIPAGKIVAIVGDNGAGKSTLVKLLCRFYDPSSGKIELDGINLRDFAVEKLRRLITVLFQFPITYQLTAAENIALGDLSANPSTDNIEMAAKGAGAHEIIDRLPKKYDALLGKYFPGGTDLSGGEWQRIALARAFLRRAQMIILDEPTSAMDPWAEFDWLERFRTLANGRTAVVITHRFTLAMRADIIHVMRFGEIVESGTHNELIARGGFYAQSWKTQMEATQDSALENALV